MEGNPPSAGLGQQASRPGCLKLVDNWAGDGALNSQEEWTGQGRAELEQIAGVGLGH